MNDLEPLGCNFVFNKGNKDLESEQPGMLKLSFTSRIKQQRRYKNEKIFINIMYVCVTAGQLNKTLQCTQRIWFTHEEKNFSFSDLKKKKKIK